MILKKKNLKGSSQGLLQVAELDGWCCGDVAKAIVCKHAVQVDTLKVISGLQIGGKDFFFPSPIDVNSSIGKNALQECWRKILDELGYMYEPLRFSMSADEKMEIYTDYSQVTIDQVLVFDYSDASTTRLEFQAVDCKVIGLPKAELCKVFWLHRIGDSSDPAYINYYLKPTNIIPGATYKVIGETLGVADAQVVLYSGNLANGEFNVAFKGGDRIVRVLDGVISFSLPTAEYTGVQDITLQVVLPSGSTCTEIADDILSVDYDLPTEIAEKPEVFDPGIFRNRFGVKVLVHGQPIITA
jgi:hypothetical protein